MPLTTAQKLVTVLAGRPWYLAGGIAPTIVYQPKGAVSLAASYVNLASPGTNDASAGVAPTFDTAVGWIGDGTQYVISGATVSDTTWTVIVRYASLTVNGFLLGGGSGSNILGLRPQAGNVGYYFGDTFTAAPDAAASGRLAIAGTKGYRNGVVESGTIATPAAPASNPQYIFCRNNGTPANFVTCSIQAVAFYRAILTAGQIAAIDTKLAAL